MHTLAGEKSNDPQSPAYVPSIFDSTKDSFSDTKVTQMLRRYESIKRRQQRRDELEAAESLCVVSESSSPGDTSGFRPVEENDQNDTTS